MILASIVSSQKMFREGQSDSGQGADLYMTDIDLISGTQLVTMNDPWNKELGVSSEHCRAWPQNKKKI